MPKYTLPTEPTAGRVILPTEPSVAPRISVYPTKPSTTPSVPYRDIKAYKDDIIQKAAQWYAYALENDYERQFGLLFAYWKTGILAD